jgi:hypothetical protein
MKKILLLLIGLTIISCSSDDDDVVVRTTDPFIGSWISEDEDEYGTTVAINSNGTLTVDFIDENMTGRWSNSGSDFSLFNQTYTLVYSDGDIDTFTVIFSEDFNSWADDGMTWTRR